MAMQSVKSEDGSAIVEFVTFGIATLMPLSLLLSGIFTLQKASFTAQAAVREATRAFVKATTDEDAFVDAQEAANLVFRDASMQPVRVRIACSLDPCLSPSGNVRVSLKFPVSLAVKEWVIQAHHEERVDPWS